MGRADFGKLVERHMQAKGLSQGRLAARLGEFDDGRYFDATGIRLLIQGKREIDDELFSRLVELLDIDPAEAYFTLGIWPADLTLVEYRRLRESGRPAEPALTRVGGSDTPLAPSLRKARTAPRTEGRRRSNSCCPRLPAHRRRLLGPAHIGQRVAGVTPAFRGMVTDRKAKP
jgi:transcriptional regulator with XRE-family HTH domain